jgi:hypothetical protein
MKAMAEERSQDWPKRGVAVVAYTRTNKVKLNRVVPRALLLALPAVSLNDLYDFFHDDHRRCPFATAP